MAEGRDAPRGYGGIRIRNPQDFWGGLAITALAGFAFYASYSLPGIQGFSFGSGTAPRLFSVLLGFLGMLIVFVSLLNDGPKVSRYAVRGPVLVTASILMFAALIRPLGLVLTSFLMFMLAASASSETRWLEATITAVAMTIFCVFVFSYLLNLPFQLWPQVTILGLGTAL